MKWYLSLISLISLTGCSLWQAEEGIEVAIVTLQNAEDMLQNAEKKPTIGLTHE